MWGEGRGGGGEKRGGGRGAPARARNFGTLPAVPEPPMPPPAGQELMQLAPMQNWPEARMSPATSRVLPGAAVPMPTLPNVFEPALGPTKSVGMFELKPTISEFSVLLVSSAPPPMPVPRTNVLEAAPAITYWPAKNEESRLADDHPPKAV